MMMKVMRVKSLKSFSSLAVLICLGLTRCSCSFTEYNFKKAESLEGEGQHAEAIRNYEKIILKHPDEKLALESLRKAARIADFELKDFTKALELYNRLILLSPDAQERIGIQKTIAEIYFDKMNDYASSIREYNKLLSLKVPLDTQVDSRLRIAKSHYYISEFFQAETEAERALASAHSPEKRFEIELFLANVYYNTKRTDKALNKYRELLETYPKLARKENVEMSIVVALEETQEFARAISLLEDMKEYYPEPDFIDLKIKSLKHRQANMPGSRGLRK